MNYMKRLWHELLLRLRVLRETLLWAVPVPGFLRGETVPVGRLYVKVNRADGTTEDRGIVSTKVVTDAGVDFIVDAFQGTAAVSDFSWHASGTDNTAEAASDTALGVEVASRTDGSQTENGTNVYRTVGTISYSSSYAIVEHGIFSATSGGTLLDRSVFSAINVANGDSIEFTYDLTVPSGS